MAANSTSDVPQLPNPFTPMAFLPPDIAVQVTNASYLLVASLGIMVWDVLNNLQGDWRLLTKHRITIPTVVYFISRVGSLAYVLSSTIFETAAVTNDCARFEKILDGLFPVAVPASSLLFFFRVRAVFDRNKMVVAFFAFMWLAVLGGCITVAFGVTGINIGRTKYCLNAALEGYVAAAAIIPLINDTLVFAAISWRLIKNSHGEQNIRTGVKAMVSGDYLPAFSRTLLQDGQAYYLTTVSLSLLTVIMLYVPNVPITYQTMFTVPNIAVMNIMACRVFRNTKFGIFRETAISTSKMNSTGSRDERTMNGSVIPLSFRKTPNQFQSTHMDTQPPVAGVEVYRTVENKSDLSHSSLNTYEKSRTMV